MFYRNGLTFKIFSMSWCRLEILLYMYIFKKQILFVYKILGGMKCDASSQHEALPFIPSCILKNEVYNIQFAFYFHFCLLVYHSGEIKECLPSVGLWDIFGRIFSPCTLKLQFNSVNQSNNFFLCDQILRKLKSYLRFIERKVVLLQR